MATRAQELGSVKDNQAHLQHSRAETTANESLEQIFGKVHLMLTNSEAPQPVIQRNAALRLNANSLNGTKALVTLARLLI